MTTISYAQNYEDVMLLRALGNVQRGFYIDIGAQHPVHGSVTKAFYEKGWRGINIEPVSQWFELLAKDRPADTNLKIAISDTGEEMELYEIADTGLSTSTTRYADMHQSEGRTVERHVVACRSLDDVIAEYADGEIHFLKIDVEGAEGSVLKSISLDRHRPWIMVVEATEPNSQNPAYADWEPRVLQSGYEMVYEDGLNRFYLANERVALKEAFRLPPNYFDFFIPYSEWCTRNELGVRTGELAAFRERMRTFDDGAVLGALRQRLFQERALHRLASRKQREAQLECDRLADELLGVRSERSAANIEIGRLKACEQASERARALAESELALIKRSRSWRLTQPLRAVTSVTVGVGRGWRKLIRAGCASLARLLVRTPGARLFARRLLRRFPGIKRRIVILMYSAQASNAMTPASIADDRAVTDERTGLSRSASEALDLLKQRRVSEEKTRRERAS